MSIFNATAPSAGGGGLEYEEGTYKPTSDVSSGTVTIPFINTHSDYPAIVVFVKTSYVSSSSRAIYKYVYIDWTRLTGKTMRPASGTSIYQTVEKRSNYDSSLSDTTFNAPQTYVTYTGIKLSVTSSMRIYANEEYSWIAIWK